MSSGTSGTIGTTSAAPTRGCAPSCCRRSMRSHATATPAARASESSSACPTRVKTDRLWSASEWTSRRSAYAESAAPIASTVATSRPSLKFGTDSSGRTAPTLGAVDGTAEYELGGEHDSAGRPAEAVPHYERALELGLPDELLPGCLLQLGSTLRNLGRLDEAVMRFDQGLPRVPNPGSLRPFRAVAFADPRPDREAPVELLDPAQT